MSCGTTRSVTCIQIRTNVAEWVIPQHITRCSNVLRNHPFHNVYTDLYASYGMVGFVICLDTSQCVAEPLIPQQK